MLPRIDEWLIGENETGSRTYIIHSQHPVFICEVFDEDSPVIGEIEYSCRSDQTFSRFVWYDEPVTDEQEFLALCQFAEAALSEYDKRLGLE